MFFKIVSLILLSVVLMFGGDYVIKDSKYSVAQTVKNIQNISKEKGLEVYGVIDHRASAKKAGMDMTDETVIMIGKAKIGTRFMLRDPKSGIELPYRILVYKDYDGKTKVMYLDPKAFEKRFDLSGCGVIPKIDKTLNMITDKAVQ